MYSNGYNAYKNNSVNYASKEQLLLMLLDGAVKFSKIGRQAIVEKDIKRAHDSITRTQDIFTELRVSLDQNVGEWAVQMFNVYGFINEKLFEANIKKDEKIMDEVIPLIEEVRDIWYAAEKKSKSS
ncbi:MULTISPECIES: flagellar export chaperone FliS [Clostridium]|uniref:flagellar export chaperone FliS n=1 Tax=Clostridium TaxID=1485 RepID=UPI00210483A7|nr:MULTISPECIES: flagellar export chaperone FliS [Clostridium]MBS4840285.1 flagellar export chaperone FliS [Clostridium sp.]MCQ2014200.1 flagellar export chaperone FliS [Clostridium butyricum]MCQ2018567.1 flagellar export chaperone FliS [Clostridium butyricum]MCQ2026290.1 flagellar export chaperone FliS [Clostridium butyricum]MDU1401673.1 flagellar export chaperone FliS [Clostridium sp.]